jgi:hypothetical protein
VNKRAKAVAEKVPQRQQRVEREAQKLMDEWNPDARDILNKQPAEV